MQSSLVYIVHDVNYYHAAKPGAYISETSTDYYCKIELTLDKNQAITQQREVEHAIFNSTPLKTLYSLFVGIFYFLELSA